MNLADDEPAPIETLDGTFIKLLLVLRPMETVDAVAPVSAAVQEDDAPELSVEGVQVSEERLTDTGGGGVDEPAATRLSENVLLTPDALAVRVAVALFETLATFAVKLALVLPAPMLTLAGMVTLELLLDSDTGKAVDGAAPPTETVHAAVPGVFTMLGEQENPDRTVCVANEMLPPVPEAGIAEPSPLAANAFVIWMGTLALCVPAEIWKVAVATGPCEMDPKSRPETMQVVLPLVVLQRMFFCAVEAAEPVETVTPVISAVEYFMLHCRLAGCAPPESVRETLSVTRPPGLPEPELSASPTCCADAVNAPPQLKTHAASRAVRILNLLAKYLCFSFAFNIETPIYVSSAQPYPLSGRRYTLVLFGKGQQIRQCWRMSEASGDSPPKLGTRILREYSNKIHAPQKAEFKLRRIGPGWSHGEELSGQQAEA